MLNQPTYEALENKISELEKLVTELRHTESLLRDEINLRRLLVEESIDAIVVLDQCGKVYEANNRFADMLGYSRDEVYELHVWDWDALLSKKRILELINSVTDAGQHFETQHRRKDGRILDMELCNNGLVYRGKKLVFCICRDVSDQKKAEKERSALVKKLQDSLSEIRTLRGILPLCSFCKKIRNDQGYWEQVDVYLNKHSEADISHSICPECMKQHYPFEYEEVYAQQTENKPKSSE